MVPAAVVQRGPQGSFAYVIKENNTAEMRTVKVGQIEDGLALIDDGLKVGERVVVDGQYKLQDGSQVDVTNNSPDPAKTISENTQKSDQDPKKPHHTAKKNGESGSADTAAAP